MRWSRHGRGTHREIAGYRDALDELKVALGLSPHAVVIPDRRSIAAFRQVFDMVDDWQRRPDRSLAELPRIVERLPALGDVVVNGRRLDLRVIEQDPMPMESVLVTPPARRSRIGPTRARTAPRETTSASSCGSGAASGTCWRSVAATRTRSGSTCWPSAFRIRHSSGSSCPPARRASRRARRWSRAWSTAWGGTGRPRTDW